MTEPAQPAAGGQREIIVAPPSASRCGWLQRKPPLSTLRIVLACIVAVVTDALQFVTGPFGWVGLDQALDVIAMGLTTWLIGFHPLLLPTFVLEAIPFLEDIPTWSGCVVTVIILRRRQAARAMKLVSSPPPETTRAQKS